MPSTLTPMPPVTDTLNPLAVLRELQHGEDVTAPRLDLVTAHEIRALLPDVLRPSVSLRWIRANVPGKRRIGRVDVWPRVMVMDYFLEAGMVEE